MRRLFWVLIMIIMVISTTGFSWGLPEVDVPEASLVYDINNEPIRGLSSENRVSIPSDEIPEGFKKAVIAVEDKNFYRHHGIDMTGIIRAAYANIRAGKIVAGGSTITQQTAKNLFLSNERTFLRKLKEVYFAVQLERRYSKEEILTLYCNTIYFGEGAYGIEAAAHTYFADSAENLSLAESVLLAGLPQWPSHYNPYVNPQAAKARQEQVLQRMVDEGYISKDEKTLIAEEELVYKKDSYIKGDAAYFIDMVKDYISKRYGERVLYQGGLKIYTSLDLSMQRAANKAVDEGLSIWEHNFQTALVALDVHNGQIRAVVGGKSFTSSPYNRVFAKRQPGSTFKPFIYSLAIDHGYTAADMLTCEEVEFKLPNGEIYKPTDYGDEPYHWRDFTLKEAVMKSDNVIAVRLNGMLGPENSANYAEKFGFNDLKPVLSLPLGSIEATPLQMAAAYAVFANQGIYSEPVYILRIIDRNGKVLEENLAQQKQLIDAENAYIITDMLKGVMEPGGTASRLKNIYNGVAAGKTGTTDEFKDAWFVGYTPELCCAVWVGYDNGKSTGLAGGVAAGPIWAKFMQGAANRFQKGDFVKPQGIEIVNICLDTGLIATESCPRTVAMAFRKGSEPDSICYHHAFDNLGW